VRLDEKTFSDLGTFIDKNEAVRFHLIYEINNYDVVYVKKAKSDNTFRN
jgi:hypothetical protein